MHLKNWLSVFFILLPCLVFSQLTNSRCKWVPYSEEAFILDSVSVLPNSVFISEPSDSLVIATYDINTRKVLLSGGQADSVLICYKVFPWNLTQKFYNREKSLYDTNQYYRENYRYNINGYGYPIADKDQVLSTPGINKSGSITRGISFGNNQNVFVNSALNLQMDGRITDDIGITAVISDQNIPFQPEGNTQQLQEFDKVFIQLHSKKSTLTAGDLVMQNRPGHFLKYYRNVQGGQFEGRYDKDSSVYSVISAGAAVSKGKFGSIQVDPIEGVQGPYRLRGPNNERFIIVLANSEKVYVDGKLLKRGFDYDYTIDYNQAEITFTNKILITKFSVIRVDFEYSERNYGRINANASHYQTWGKLDAYVNYYIQRDNPNNPLLYSISNEEKQQLSLIGDDLSQAVISGIDSTGYQENKILYERVDSLGKEVFIYSVNPSEAVYDVAFTDVGGGFGDYEQVISTSNGKVFEYVGEGMGRYLPVRVIATPKKNQMITVGGSYELGEGQRVYSEVAFSDHDENLYSKIGDNNDAGKALKVGFVNEGKRIPFLNNVKVISSVDFEYTEKEFKEIDRFREINFERDWSGDPEYKSFNRIFNASVGLEKDVNNNLVYNLSRRVKGEDVNGFQHSFTGNKSFGKLKVSSNGWWMVNNKREVNSDWKRFNVNTSWDGKYLVPGVIYAFDKNQIESKETKEILGSAMHYDEVQFYVKSNDTADFQFYSDYAIRTDKDTVGGVLKPATEAHTFNSGFSTNIKGVHDISTQFTYRKLNYYDLPFREELQGEETVLTRIDWRADLLQRHVRSELTVTTGTGRELKREFFYQAVPQGTGTHIWDDFNKDGVQDLNEFIEKVAGLPYNQQEFIRVFIPTDEYVKAYTGVLNYRLDLSAPRNWRNDEKKVKVFLSKFSSTSSWTVNKKVLSSDLWSRFNPSEETNESDVLSAQRAMRTTLFFNRTSPRYGMDLLYAANETKSLMTQGFESRVNQETQYSARLNFKQIYNLKVAAGHRVKNNSSDFLNQRNFTIESYSLKPEFSWLPKSNLRLTTSLSLTDRANIQGTVGEKATFYEAGLETRFSAVSRRTIAGNMKYINISADLKETPVSSPIGYEMLDALRPGNNFTWSISWQEKLVNGLQISFIYEGRKSESSNTIHTGRMQASAFF